MKTVVYGNCCAWIEITGSCHSKLTRYASFNSVYDNNLRSCAIANSEHVFPFLDLTGNFIGYRFSDCTLKFWGVLLPYFQVFVGYCINKYYQIDHHSFLLIKCSKNMYKTLISNFNVMFEGWTSSNWDYCWSRSCGMADSCCEWRTPSFDTIRNSFGR